MVNLALSNFAKAENTLCYETNLNFNTNLFVLNKTIKMFWDTG